MNDKKDLQKVKTLLISLLDCESLAYDPSIMSDLDDKINILENIIAKK